MLVPEHVKPAPPVPHVYPPPGEHLWGPWMLQTARPTVTQYRKCCVPSCSAFETREVH